MYILSGEKTYIPTGENVCTLSYHLHPALKCDDAIAKDSCLFKLFTWLYFFRRADKVALKSLKKHAQALSINEFDQNWIFIYETLSAEQLKDDWKPMKRAGISFVKADIRRTSAS